MLLFVDNLINVDFSYLDAKRGLVGETWLASVELEGGLDAQGMVCDFGIVKKTIREWLDKQIDHRLLIPTQTTSLLTNIELENTEANDSRLRWHYSEGELELCSPSSALTFIPRSSISAECVANWCVEQLSPLFPESVKSLKLTFQTENIQGPFYHYSHGLKKHAGNCQRIAHGHRSKIEIWINDKLSQDEMTLWANSWKDIYLGSEEDIIENNNDNLLFSYTAHQGDFKLRIPKSSVYLIPSDTTVELIAAHIAQKIKEKHPQETICVKAFEGSGKGAIAYA